MRVLVAIFLLTCVGCTTDNKIPLDSDLYGFWGNRNHTYGVLFSSHGKFFIGRLQPKSKTFEDFSMYGNYYVVGNNIVFQTSAETNISEESSDSHLVVVANYSIQDDTLTLSCHHPFFDEKMGKIKY